MDENEIAILRLKSKGLWDMINPLSTIETLGKAYLQDQNAQELERYHGLEPVERVTMGYEELPGSLSLSAQKLSPEQRAQVRSRLIEDSIGGLMDMPPAIGAIRKTPTGKLLGTVSREALEIGPAQVQNELIDQALNAGELRYESKAMKDAVAPVDTRKTLSSFGAEDRAKFRQKIIDDEAIFSGKYSGSDLTPMTNAQKNKAAFQEMYEARFGDKPPKNGFFYKNPAIKEGDALVIDTYGRGDIHNAPLTLDGTPKKSIRDWNRPMPFVSDPVAIEKALAKHDGPIVLGAKSDPFMWMEHKYGSTKKILDGLEGRDITIRTRSDLVGREDYVDLLRKNNTTVQLVMPPIADDDLVRVLEPGAPSIKRRLKAAKSLQKNGIKVELVQSPYDVNKEMANLGYTENSKPFSPRLELQKMKNMLKELDTLE